MVGVFKAYQEMTGKELPQENVDTALNELVLTGQLESSTGADAESVEGLVAYLKQQLQRMASPMMTAFAKPLMKLQINLM